MSASEVFLSSRYTNFRIIIIITQYYYFSGRIISCCIKGSQKMLMQHYS